MKEFICFVFGHDYFLAQTLSNQSRRMCCKRCSKSFSMNDDCQVIVDWDSSFHRFYESHGVKIEYLPFEYSKQRNPHIATLN